MTDHEHDFWITRAGTLECACGKSKHPIETAQAREQETK